MQQVKIFMAAIALFTMSATGIAATYYVAPAPAGDDGNTGTQAAPFATIQRALDAITPENCWKSIIRIEAGTYQIGSELKPTSGTYTFTVQSVSGDPSDVTIDAQGTVRCFNSTGATGISFEGITFINGSASGNGGGVLATDKCTFDNCVVSNCTATGRGGGIYLSNTSGSSIISNCRIRNCSGDNRGGGLCMECSTVCIVDNCDISGNTVSQVYGGGGIFAKNVTIRNCTVTNNVCTYSGSGGTSGGSGIRLLDYGAIDGCLVKDNTFENDCADYNGGGSAVWLVNGASLVNSAIIGNSGSRSVGLQWTNCGGILVSNCLFKSNVARRTDANGRGGVLSLFSLTSDSLITDCRFIDNEAKAGGGLVEMRLDSGSKDAALTIRNCLMSGNVQNAESGLFWLNSNKSASAHRFILENCTIVSNTIPSGPVVVPYWETDFTSRNFVFVKGCAILFNNGKAAFDDTYKASANVTYNCTELSGMSEGNRTYDSSKPLFEDLVNGNYRPAAGSQLLNAVPAAAWMGDGSKRSPSRDLGTWYELRTVGTYGVDVVWTDTVPRLHGTAADIGCFEYWMPPGLMLFVR